MLSIIVPVRNETNIIHEVFDYFSTNLKNINYEVLIINDFSDDDTLEKSKSLATKYANFKVLNNKKKGLGGAINLGIREASGDNISIMMADLSDDINDFLFGNGNVSYDDASEYINFDNIKCKVCNRGDREDVLIECDSQDCNNWAHIDCVSLDAVPDATLNQYWYCGECGQISNMACLHPVQILKLLVRKL